MPARAKLETLAAATLFIACGAFLISFVLGIGGRGGSTAAAAPESAVYTQPERVPGRIEVLNASGRAGLARFATQRLRDGGFDVVYFGNAAGFDGDSSLVLDRTGNDAVARAAARRLGIVAVQTRRDTTLFLDATVVIGRDWVLAEPDDGERAPDGWRARIGRWLRPS